MALHEPGHPVDHEADAITSVPALLAGSGLPFALWWSGDAQLDAVLASATALGAAQTLVGAERTTRPVVRSLAASLIGPGGVLPPGANADLLAVSLMLGVDAPAGDPGRLTPDDIAAVLGAVASPQASPRRAPVDVFARDALRRLLVGATRRRRRELAIAVVTDRSGDGELLLRLLDEAAEVAYLETFDAPTCTLPSLVAHLQWVVAHYRVPSRRVPLAGARNWRGRPPVRLPGGLQVRVAWNRELLEAEGAAFRNCLGSYYLQAEIDGTLIATVWEHEAPLAAAEISRSGRLQQVLGVDDAAVDAEVRGRVVDVLRQAGVLPQPVVPAPLTVSQRVTGRIACRAALLLAEEIEPQLDAYDRAWSGREYGDRTLGMLGRSAELLTAEEYEQLRAGHVPDPVAGWSHVGAMLVAAGAQHPDLAVLDGRAPFRQAARNVGRQTLAGTYRPDVLRAPADLRSVLPALPGWQQAAVTEVLTQHLRGP